MRGGRGAQRRDLSNGAGEVRSQHTLILGFHSPDLPSAPERGTQGPLASARHEKPLLWSPPGAGRVSLSPTPREGCRPRASHGGRNGLGAPVHPVPPAGPVALTSRVGRQRRRSQAASPQQQSPQLARHVCPNQVPRAAARAGTEAFLRRRVMTSWPRVGGRALRAPAGGRGFRGTRETVRASGRDLRDLASCCQGRRAERGAAPGSSRPAGPQFVHP